MAHKLQATALCLLALVLCASAAPASYYYGGARRLSEAQGFGRQLQSTGYYYGGSHQRKLFAASYPYYGGGGARRLQESTSFFARPLFGDSFMPAARSSSASDVPVPQFLARQLQSTGRQLTYYYGSRRLQSADLSQAGRSLASYYYGSR